MGNKLIDEMGNRYDRLTVLEYRRNRIGYAAWLCKCACGNGVIVRGSALRSGNTKSCGCLWRERVKMNRSEPLPWGVAAFNQLFSQMRRSAKNRGHTWSLAQEQVRVLTKQNCYYCGTKPQQRMKNQNNHGDYIYNGIDRIDNTKGYVINNTVSCCGNCNRAKGMMTTEQFKEWLTRAYKHFIEE